MQQTIKFKSTFFAFLQILYTCKHSILTNTYRGVTAKMLFFTILIFYEKNIKTASTISSVKHN